MKRLDHWNFDVSWTWKHMSLKENEKRGFVRTSLCNTWLWFFQAANSRRAANQSFIWKGGRGWRIMQHEQMRIHHLALIMNCAHFPKASWHKAPQHALTHQLIDSSPCRVANACMRDQSRPHNQVILCWLLLFDSLTQHYNIKCGVLCKHETLCPSGLRGWTQVPLAQAAWVQIPQVSYLMLSAIYRDLRTLGLLA